MENIYSGRKFANNTKIDRFNLFFLITEYTLGKKSLQTDVQNLWLGLNKQYKHVERTYISIFRFTSLVFGRFWNWKFPSRLCSFFFNKRIYVFLRCVLIFSISRAPIKSKIKIPKDRAEKIFVVNIAFYRPDVPHVDLYIGKVRRPITKVFFRRYV